MCRCSQTRTILIRLTVFVLTAGAAQLLTNFVSKSGLLQPHALVQKTSNNAGSFSVTASSLSIIELPKSIPKNRTYDFSIPSSMVVDADGSVRDIEVNDETVGVVVANNFIDDPSSPTSNEIAKALIETLTLQMKQSKFRPRTFDGQPLPTMVFVTSRFRAYGEGCPVVETELKAAGKTISKGPTSVRCPI